MDAGKNPTITPADVLRVLREYRLRWLVPTAIGAVLGIAYAVVRPDQWEASQALLIRDEAANSSVEGGPGKFRQIDDMKVVQETVVELAKSKQVLEQALTKVGPPGDASDVGWPTAKAIDKLRKHVKVTPPKGAELGKTQVFYLKVADNDRQRAVDLATAICDALQARFQDVLNKQGTSMVRELTNGVKLAQEQVDEASAKLSEMERQIGADLSELRNLHTSANGGSSELRQRVVFIEGELRRLQIQERGNEELLRLLKASQQDTQNLIAAPNSLLESQPALRRLKDGLVDAQIKTSQLRGSMTDEHPMVKASLDAEEAIRDDIHAELGISIRGVESDTRLVKGQTDVLKKQLAETNERLGRIAELRTKYSNLVSNVDHANKLLSAAEDKLADARAKQTGALEASLINRIDSPDTGIKPIGPSRALIALAGALGGFVTGLGILVLTTPAPSQWQSTSEPAPAREAAEKLSIAERFAAVAKIASDRAAGFSARRKEAAPQKEPVAKKEAAAKKEAISKKEVAATFAARPAVGRGGEKLTLKQALSRVQPRES